MLTRKPEKSAEDFWQEYEEKTGEQIIARSLGRYVSGWEEFDSQPGNPIWGLIIVTSGGFRFHHFPQANWFSAFSRQSGDPPKEKTIFIPTDRIISAILHKEIKWYRKIFFSNSPRLVIRYRDETGIEKELLLYADHKPDGVAEALTPLTPPGLSY